MNKNNLFLFFILGSFLSFLLSTQVLAAEPEVVVKDEGYSAQFVSQSIADPIEIEVGSTQIVTFKFKNTGTYTWNNAGSRYISAYTMEPRDRNSVFFTTGWKSAKQTGKMLGMIVPGEIGSLEIKLKAPATTGEYIERFYLAAENYSWVKGGYFYIKINVVPMVVQAEPVVVEDGLSEENTYSLNRIILSPKSLSLVGGEMAKVIVGYQNTSEVDWSNWEIIGDNDYADESWISSSEVFKSNQSVLAGGFLRHNIYLRAPAKKGQYIAEFILNIDGDKLTDKIQIPIVVTADAVKNYEPPVFSDEDESDDNDIYDGKVKQSLTLGVEPHIRVGISAPDSNFIQFRSYDDSYNVYADGELMGELPKRKLGVAKFINDEYSFKGGDLDFTSDDYIRLEPINDSHAVFTIANLNRSASWVNAEADFDQYRGAVEYRQGEVDKEMYIVNDLLLEDYVKGMAENSSISQPEFLKANLIAARNYAYVNRGKYPFFDVLGNTYDQLYLGVEAEESLPNVVIATEETRGIFVTYDNNIIVTPYFGHSNGLTKSWSSVWGGVNKPWLVPVKAEYDDVMYSSYSGHGVGMSQMDASNRAKNENVDFVDLLKYYYTGVEVERLYL